MKNAIITAFLLSITAFSVHATESIQHKLARVVLDAENASYMVMEQEERVSVITYGYKDAATTCRFLHEKGVNASSVENYTSGKDGMLITTYKSC